MTNVIAPQNQLFTSMISPLPPPPLRKVNMMLNVNRNPKAYSKNGEKGRGVLCGGGRVYIYIYTLPPPYISLHCHYQNDSCIRWAATMRAILMFHSEDKVTRQCPQTTAVFEEKKKKKNESRSEIGPRPFCYALLLGQTVSLSLSLVPSPRN